MNLYQKYLVADMIQKRLERVGAAVMYTLFSNDPDVSVRVSYNDADGKWMYDVDRESKANEFLELFPDSTVTRDTKYSGKPEINISGVTNLGVHWTIDFGSGVCEQVQVGTREVEEYDPEDLAKLTPVIKLTPIYEYRCADPIVAAGLVSA